MWTGGEVGMTDREKVIKGLQGVFRCVSPVNHTCRDCPYQDNHVECVRRVLNDALALLKVQEPQATTHEAEWHIFKGQRGATCSYCKHTFDDVYDPENYDYYCRHCGARMVRIRTVKWE